MVSRSYFSWCTYFSSQRTANALLHSSAELLETESSPVMALVAMTFPWERSNGHPCLLSRSRTNVPGPLLSWLSVSLGTVSTISPFSQSCASEKKDWTLLSSLEQNFISTTPRKRFQVNGLQLATNTSQQTCMRAVRFKKKNIPVLSSSYSRLGVCILLWISFWSFYHSLVLTKESNLLTRSFGSLQGVFWSLRLLLNLALIED